MSLNSLTERDLNEEEFKYIHDLVDSDKTGLSTRINNNMCSYTLQKKFALVKEALTRYHVEIDEETKKKYALRISMMIVNARLHDFAVIWYAKNKILSKKEVDHARTDMTFEQVRASTLE